MRSRATIDAIGGDRPSRMPWPAKPHITIAGSIHVRKLANMAVETNADPEPAANGRLIPRTRPAERLAAVVLVVAALAIAGQFAWQEDHSPAPLPAPASAPASATIGAVDAPSSEAIVGTAVHIVGWALDPKGIRSVEIRLDGHTHVARYGIARPDVAQVKPG